MKKIITLISIFTLIVNGCVDNTSVIDTESILINLLDSDEATGISGFETGGEMDLDYVIGLDDNGVGRILDDTLSYGEGYRIRWGKNILDYDRVVDFDTGVDTSIGLVTHTMDGEFIVQAFDTSNFEQIDSISFTKYFTTIMTRKVRFVKVNNDNSPDGYSWKLDALTPMVGGAGDKVKLNYLTFHSLTDDMEEDQLLYSYSLEDLGNLFIKRDSLPVFTAFDLIGIYAGINNTGPEYTNDSTGVGEWVFFSYGRDRMHRARRRLNDAGMFFDDSMNNDQHSGVINMHGFGQQNVVCRTFTSVKDLATILVSDGGYNTNVWSIPYNLERP